MSSKRERFTKLARLMVIVSLILLLPIFGERANRVGLTQQITSQQKRYLAHRSKQAPPKRLPKRQTSVKRGWSIRRAFIQPVRCKECKLTHGNVIVILRNGKRLQLTRNGMCFNLQIAPDRRTIGWLEGHHEYDIPAVYLMHPADKVTSDYLVIWRANKVLARIGVKYQCIWQFRDGGKKVATTGAVTPVRPLENIYALYDAETGKRLAEWSDGAMRWNEDKTPPPAWAGELFKRVWNNKDL